MVHVVQFLIHDHPKPSSNKDKDYEKIRFTRSILKESADYLENKWGMVFWSAPVDDWLEEKQRSFELTTQHNDNLSQFDDNKKARLMIYLCQNRKLH